MFDELNNLLRDIADMTRKDLVCTVSVLALAIVAVWELGKAIPVAAAPPLSTAVSIADPNTPTQQVAVDSNGFMGYTLHGGAGSAAVVNSGNSDGQGTTNSALSTGAYNLVFNGTNWDRLRGTANAGMSVAPYGVNMVPQANTSGIVANAVAVATLPGTAGKTTYLSSWTCSNTGATAQVVQSITISGVLGGSETYFISVPTVASGTVGQTSGTFPAPLPASAVNTAITVAMGAAGAGNLNAECHANGFQL